MTTLLEHSFTAFVRSGIMLAVAAIVVGLALRLLRPRSPFTHRTAWACVLLCGALVFQLSFDVPFYDPIPRDAVTSVDELSLRSGDAALELGRVPSDTAMDDEAKRQASGIVSPRRSEVATGVSVHEHAPATTKPLAVEPAALGTVDWWMLLVGVWVAGIAGVLTLSAVSYGVLLSNLREAKVAPPAWQRPWRRLMRERGRTARVPLLAHPHLGPLLCRLPSGYAVVVPESLWSDFSEQERLAILRHELGHYERGDVWTSLLARILALPHWYNPLAWWAVRRFEEGGEWACDARLLADPRQVPAFAQALLAITTSNSKTTSNRVCTTAARGSSLSVRIKRLLTFQSPEDAPMKRLLLLSVLGCLLVGGLLRVHLTVRAQDPETPAEATETTPERVQEFVKQLADNDDLESFRQALDTPAGRIVLRDHVAHYEEQLRDQARTNALPRYLDQYFVKEGDAYRLRDDQQAYKEAFLRSVNTFNQDVDRIKAALKNISASVSGQTEADRLLVRFMNHDGAPAVLYVKELRKRLRPDTQVVERLLGRLFVADGNGRYIIRPGQRDEAQRILDKVLGVRSHLKAMRSELKEWSQEFAEKDELHKKVKQALAEPTFASFVAAKLIEDGEGKFGEKLNRFFEQLGEVAVDTADGLEVVGEDQRRHIADSLDEYRRVLKTSEMLSPGLKAFAAKVDDQDPLEKGWKEILSSDLVMVRLGGEYEFTDADPEDVIRDMLSEALTESPDGKLSVPAERAEQLTENVRELLRQYRTIRLHGRMIDQMAENVDDEELRAAFETQGGKFVVIFAVQATVRGGQYDGFPIWVDEHFTETDQGLVLREGADEMVGDFLESVAAVNEELEKDDF